jgi:hypothetical protein
LFDGSIKRVHVDMDAFAVEQNAETALKMMCCEIGAFG